MIIPKSVFLKGIAIVVTVSIFIVLKVRSVSLSHAGAFCNTVPPPNVITSSKNELRLWFYSDKTDAYQGFNATYTSQWEQGTSDQNHDTKEYRNLQTLANFDVVYPVWSDKQTETRNSQRVSSTWAELTTASCPVNSHCLTGFEWRDDRRSCNIEQ